MPRTKRSRTTRDSAKGRDATAVKIFEKQAQLRIAKVGRDALANLKILETFVDLLFSRLPPEIRQTKLGELRLLDWQQGKASSSDVVPRARKPRTTTATSDDGYSTGSGPSRAKLSEINQKMVKPKPKGKEKRLNETLFKSKFQTPTTSKLPFGNTYGMVTPKVKPNVPLNVLRRPRQGEMVLSMQGSPLLVSGVVEEKTANINVPLANGSVMSLLPRKGLRMSNIPPLDLETMHQLETLKNHIEKVIALK